MYQARGLDFLRGRGGKRFEKVDLFAMRVERYKPLTQKGWSVVPASEIREICMLSVAPWCIILSKLLRNKCSFEILNKQNMLYTGHQEWSIFRFLVQGGGRVTRSIPLPGRYILIWKLI